MQLRTADQVEQQDGHTKQHDLCVCGGWGLGMGGGVRIEVRPKCVPCVWWGGGDRGDQGGEVQGQEGCV
jgi:hypothetical protein